MAKRGPKPIPMPDDFKKAYEAAKADKKSDSEIANSYFVDSKTLYKWKKEVGFELGQFKKYCGPKAYKRPSDFKQLYLEYKDRGLTDIQISKIHLVSVDVIRAWKRAVGFQPGQFRNISGLKNQGG